MDFKSGLSLLLILTAAFKTFECAPQTSNVQGAIPIKHVTMNGPKSSEPVINHETGLPDSDLGKNQLTSTDQSITNTTTKPTTAPPTPSPTPAPTKPTPSPTSSTHNPSPTPTTHSPSPTPTTHSPSPTPTTGPPTSPAPTTIKPTPSPTPAPKPDDRSFDFPSFMGGAILTLGLISISYVVYKYYRSRSDAYRTL